MRIITTKYDGFCKKCGAELKTGVEVMYEKSMGIFCEGCEPLDAESVRYYRRLKANAKAEKYAGWAKKRREKAEAILEHNRKHYTGDIAFLTQPGHIPHREKVFAQNHRAIESLSTAERMEAKSNALRNVRVAGDAEKARQKTRDDNRQKIKVGMTVDTCLYGMREILKINKKTVIVKGTDSDFTVDLSFLRI